MPQVPERRFVDRLPAALCKLVGGQVTARKRPDQFVTSNPCAIVGKQAARGNEQRDAARARVAQRALPKTIGPIQLVEPIQRQWLQCTRHFQFEQMRGRRRNGIGAQQSVRQHLKALDRDGLKAKIQRPGLPRSIDPRFDEAEEFVEDGILQRDRQREDAVEPALDRRKIIDHPAFGTFDAQAGQILELHEADRFKLASEEQPEPSVEGVFGVAALQIIGRIKEILPAGLPLAARQRAKAVEAAGNRRDEAALAANIRRHRSKQWGRGLVGTIGPPEPLDGSVSPPAWFEQEVNAPRLVSGGQIGVIAAPSAAGIGEDQDALVAVHEGMRFGDIGAWCARLQLLAAIWPDNQPPGPAGDFGNLIGAEPFDDGIERGCDRWQCAQVFDHAVARRNGRAAQHGLTQFIAHWLGPWIAVLVSEDRHQTDWKAFGEILDHIFARRQVDFQGLAFFGREVGKSAVEHRLGRRDELDHDGMAAAKCRFDGGQQAWQLHREQKLREKALLGALEDRQCGGLGARVERAATVAINDARRFERLTQVRVDDRPAVGVGIVDRNLVGCQAMFEDFIFDTGERQRPCGIEAERLEVASDQFHRGNAASADVGDEFLAVRKRGFRTPQAKPGCVGQVVDVRRPGCRCV